MAFKVVVGNLLARPDVLKSLSPAADDDFPAEYLGDGPGQLGARFGSLGADPKAIVDLGLVPYGDGGEDATEDLFIAYAGPLVPAGTFVPSDWTVRTQTNGAGVVLRIVSDGAVGSADLDGNGRSLYLTGTPEDHAITTASVFTSLRPGASYQVRGAVQKALSEQPEEAADVDDGDVDIMLRCRETGLYLQADGSWGAPATALVAAGAYDSGATWYSIAGGGITFVAPTAAETMTEAPTVELLLRTTERTTAARADGLAIVAAVDFMGVFNGHNIPQALAPAWESSDDGSSWTSRATFTAARHQFYAELEAPVFARYHRLAMTGTPAVENYLSDLVLGTVIGFDREPSTQQGQGFTYEETGQIRQQSPAGSRRIQNRGPYPPRRWSGSFRFASAAEEEAFRAVIVDQLRGGAESVVLLPGKDFPPRAAIYGDLEEPLQVQHAPLGMRQPDSDLERFEFYSDCSIVVAEGAGFEISVPA